MGSASSKVARKLPREKPRGPTDSLRATTEPARLRPERPLASESKNETIENDAKDPHFMEKLSQLGPVRVDHHMQTVRAARSDVQTMYRSRMRSEAEAASVQPTKNCLLASSLTELFEARKSVTDRAELETLAKRYHMDATKLEQLARAVNTPSIDESTVVRHGEESVTMMVSWPSFILHTGDWLHAMNQARWIDPVLKHAK
ncbi:hypothetical protein JVT61DRAFT_2075 [Boletus reticuloceps]|uniref:Uncharacterized protein n=1 Tax=Boletus reticuloceps TaxID=495285 RepID=A0A8I3A8S0_9AGAM|nr:hypothetical protein JVT61DRAFT_2075 [Boletus reticuloceps]